MTLATEGRKGEGGQTGERGIAAVSGLKAAGETEEQITTEWLRVHS